MTRTTRSQPPEKRMAFLERVEHYVNKQPMWTPAEGALLVNGVMPPLKGCTDIPEDASQLEDILLPATQSQLLGARMLLRAYREDIDSGYTSCAERITSDEFLEWCKDGDFLPLWRQKLAEFLRHLYFPGDTHNQFPQTVEDELATLRMAMAAAEAMRGIHVLSATPAQPPSAVRHVVREKDRTTELDHLIAEAIKAVGTDETNPVWQSLKEMALSERAPFTGIIDQVTTKKATVAALVYETDTVQKDGSMKDRLTKDALASRLRRRRANMQNP